MFYGASKNKNGKDISDYDRYKPWNADDFSGKIKYTLDNGKEYEVFRDFTKKNPKVYNENLEDISDNFNIDKTKGNQFFLEQTGIDESLFFNTMATCQNDIVLNDSKQSVLVQKITNLVSSGDDNTSYKKTIDKLNKKILEEIGTTRTTERPINVIEDEIRSIEADKNNLELYKVQLQNMDNDEQLIKNELIKIEDTLNILKEIKEYKEKEILEEQRIGINLNKLNEYNEKLNVLKQNEAKKEGIIKKCLNPIILLIIFIVIIGCSVVLKNTVISAGLGIILAIAFLVNFYEFSKYKKKIDSQREEKVKYNKEIEILEKTISQCKNEIQIDREKIEKNQIQIKDLITSKYGNKVDIDNYILEETKEINKQIEEEQNKLSGNKLRENTLQVEKKSIFLKLESLASKEERLQYLYEQREELLKLSKCINLCLSGLEEAYAVMKNTVTPKFTNELTDVIKNITNNKYNKVNFNDEDGLTVELENGEYINCKRLSIGTIDQMYLALRLSILNEISKEKTPIILDESFAYYDTERLENILKYISNEYGNRQFIVLTCTDREKDILNKINIDYNLVEI